MSARALWSSAARRSLRRSCPLPRRTSAYYSQSISGRIQDPEGSTSARTGARTPTTTWSDSHRTVANTRNPLDPTRLDRYLASIKVTDLEPTLDDIEGCRPESFSRPDSTCYAAEYTNLLETLCRSFSKDQLRRFTELYKLDPIWTRSSRRKTEYAESIIEKAWGWPSLKEIERKRRDTTEMLVNLFTVTPSQLFLIMGRDGVDLLQLSTQYNVHISLTSRPLALRVEGLRGSLKGLTEYISSLKKGIIDEIFELPTGRPIRPDLLQRISRLAGAYVENHGHRGKVRICAKHLSDIIAAKRFAVRASLEVGTHAHTVCFDPPNKTRNSPIEISEPHRYSTYPFVTPSSFPWTMHSGGAFRLRRVADWLGVNSYENIPSTGGLADNPHRLLNLDQSGEQLSQLVRPTMFESTSYRRRVITASLGHVLLSSSDNSQRAAVLPPLSGTLSLPDILYWVKTSGMPMTFVPSAPPALTMVTVGKRRALRRLIYKTLPQITGQASELPQHVLTFEVELSDPLSASTQVPQDLENSPDMLSSGESVRLSDHVLCAPQSGTQPEVLNNRWDSSCQVGRERYINLMFPDRPMDMQLCIFDWDNVALMQQPQVLREYAAKSRQSLTNKAHPSHTDPPSTFSYEGRAYYLHDSLSLRQSINSSLLSTISSDCNANDFAEVCIESVVDLQGAQKTELCQVKFDGVLDGPDWRRFLVACDQLSVVPLQLPSNNEPQTVHLQN